MSSGKFSKQVVWITGASAGIGAALAKELARQGADVVVSARRLERLEALVLELKAFGGRALAVPCDVTQEDQLRAAVDRIREELGQLDVAVANAGFSVAAKIEDLTAEDWRRQLDTNVVGAALTARHALPELKKVRGRIVLVGSVSAMLPAPGLGAYTASKYALRAIGQTLSLELHGTGVTCTTIHPGFVESDIARVDNQGTFHPDKKDKRPQKLMWPTGRAAKVMADAIARRQREYVFTNHGKLGAFLGQHVPGLVHLAMTRSGARTPSKQAG